MKKITTLIILLLFIQTSISQILKYSTTENIVDLNSVACEQQTDIVSDNTFYRSFILSGFGIIGDYDITSVDYGIEIMSGARQKVRIELRFKRSFLFDPIHRIL